MPIETLTRGAKRSYEEFKAQSMRGIDSLIFNTLDQSNSSAFLLDRLITDPYAVVYRDPSNQSHVRPYQAGSGALYDIPISSEKTPIDEDLRNQSISGVEANASYNEHAVKLVNDIVKQHIEAHNMTKWKQAIDVVRTGVFNALGITGNNIGLNIDFSRAAGNDITYDFTAAGATMDEALYNILSVLRNNNCPLNGLVAIMGKNWLNQFSEDTKVIETMQANTSNVLLEQKMMPPELQGVEGLYLVARYRASSMVAPFWICSFEPGFQYKAYNGASASDWVGDNEIIVFSIPSKKFKVLRGVDAYSETGRIIRTSGDIVFDTYSEKDPITNFMRSKTRHCFVPGNINHTARSTGTF